jgi:hypothetical protein
VEELRLLAVMSRKSIFRKATKLYSSRVGAIEEDTAGMIPTAEFERLNKIASQDHEKCIEARAHLFKQGC